jgi:hypothetical protein
MRTGWKLTAVCAALAICCLPLFVGLWGCSCSTDPPPPVNRNGVKGGGTWGKTTSDEQAVKDFSNSKTGTTIILERKEEGDEAGGVLRIPELRSDKHFLEFVTEKAPPAAFQVTEIRSTSPKLTDVSMQHLPKFPNVRMLFLEGTGISSQSMMYVKELKNIEEMTLANTNVTNSGLQHIAELPNLRVLTLSGCKGVNDEGMAQLAKLSQLRELTLSETNVGDSGLFDLGQLQQLQTLNVERTKVTEEGVKNLEGMIQGTRIISDFFVPAIDPGTPPHLRG